MANRRASAYARRPTFGDVIFSERTPRRERQIADHPSLNPQSFLRALVHAALPLGVGIVADPFSGSGSTIAAADALGLHAIGVEKYVDYYRMSLQSIPKLTAIPTQFPSANAQVVASPLRKAGQANNPNQCSLFD